MQGAELSRAVAKQPCYYRSTLPDTRTKQGHPPATNTLHDYTGLSRSEPSCPSSVQRAILPMTILSLQAASGLAGQL